SKAEERTDLAVEALMNRDREKAKLVIDGDAELNRLEMEVEQAAVELLALQQPMARDLRFIIGAIKVSNDLERVGDHAVYIAESKQIKHHREEEHINEARLQPTPSS